MPNRPPTPVKPPKDFSLGRTCFACKSPGTARPVQRYKIRRFTIDAASRLETFHDTCVGSWLMSNPEWGIQFDAGLP